MWSMTLPTGYKMEHDPLTRRYRWVNENDSSFWHFSRSLIIYHANKNKQQENQ